MKMKTKSKVILVIIEGESDQITLENGLRIWLQDNYGTNQNILCELIRDDCTVYNPKTKKIISPAAIKKTLSSLINEYLPKAHYNAHDIMAVAQICDLDTCYANPTQFSKHGKKYVYHDTNMKITYFPQNDYVFLSKLYGTKVQNTQKIFNMKFISIKDQNQKPILVPYKLFYFNIDLEHALYGTTNHTPEEKLQFAENFDIDFGKDAVLFKEQLDKIPIINPDYKLSWDKSTLAVHSFDRISNISLLFEWINELNKK